MLINNSSYVKEVIRDNISLFLQKETTFIQMLLYAQKALKSKQATCSSNNIKNKQAIFLFKSIKSKQASEISAFFSS